MADLVDKKNANSAIWNYFGLEIADDGTLLEDKPICRVCSKGVAAKGGNTSNLFAHLRKYHPLKYAECKSQKQTQSKSMPTQQTLEEAISSAEKYQRSSKRWQQLTDHVTYMIAKDMMPLNTVEKSGFKRMVYAFDKKYELPSRKYISQMAIPTLYNATRANVESELREVQFYAMTADLWSSVGMVLYLSLTVHFIDNSWEYRNRCLQTSFLPSDHTGDNLADALKAALASWELKEEQQVCITTDNGSNIIHATNILKWQRVPCFGHNLNLAITNSFKNEDRVTRATALARKIVSSFSCSWKRRRDLLKVQAEKDLPQHSLIAVSFILYTMFYL